MMRPKLSVIMPVYNAEKFIIKSITSVIEQTIKSWELIIINDASTDSTQKIIDSYTDKDNRIKCFNLEKNSGAAVARNTGIIKATGKFIAFIDSDDIWLPTKSEVQINLMEKHKCDISCTSYVRIKEGNETGLLFKAPSTVFYSDILRRNPIGCSTAMIRAKTCESVFMPNIRLRQDHAYWLKLLRNDSRKAIGIDEFLVIYQVNQESISANKFIAAKYTWKLLREIEKFNIFKSIWIFLGYIYEGLKIRLLNRKTVRIP